MNYPIEKRESFRKHIGELLASRPNPDDEFVLATGPLTAYGFMGVFAVRPLEDPLKDVAVMPCKLAMRIQRFAGGSVITVSGYLNQALRVLT